MGENMAMEQEGNVHTERVLNRAKRVPTSVLESQ